MMGHNTGAAGQLQTIIERIEAIRATKKEFAEGERLVFAEARAAGFVTKAIRTCIKKREQKPHERQEEEAILDLYMHALGMAAEPPLFRQVGMIDVDVTSRDSVVEAMKAFVPEDGSITVDAGGGRPLRLTRGKDGEVTVSEVADRAPASTLSAAPGAPVMPARPEPPVCTADEAEQLGREAFKANAPIISNPFPFGDARRQRWDAGWRRESGTDGMGPDD